MYMTTYAARDHRQQNQCCIAPVCAVGIKPFLPHLILCFSSLFVLAFHLSRGTDLNNKDTTNAQISALQGARARIQEAVKFQDIATERARVMHAARSVEDERALDGARKFITNRLRLNAFVAA